MFLRAATHIGDALCRDAYWDGEACNWLGHPVAEAPDPSLPATPTVAALAANLYDGSAGVGLFLAQLHTVRREERFRRTALGAVTQALARAADSDSALSPLGFYSGSLGIAWAAACVGTWLELPEIVRRGVALAASVTAHATTDHEHVFDLVSGSSGAILALLALSRMPGGEQLAAAAQELGEELVASAVRDDEVWSWDVARAAGPGTGTRMLTGLSHGAAGIGVALAELYARTRRPEFRNGAAGAFAYEDRWFDENQQNWPDFRVLKRRTEAPPDEDPATPPSGFGATWCHGAPGIGLARLHASLLIPECAASWRRAIKAAVDTTEARVIEFMRVPGIDSTPCHGLAGLTGFLVEAARRLPDLDVDTAPTIRIWRRMIAAHEKDESWRSGIATGAANPSLMLGTAGVGHELLHLHDPGVDSLLLPTD